MEYLRRARHYTSLLLAWFLVSLAATAFAAPMQGAVSWDSVCTVPGSASSNDGGPAPAQKVGHGDHCSLCPLIGAAPGPDLQFTSPLPEPQLLLVAIPPPPPASLSSIAPLPPRGPPASS